MSTLVDRMAGWVGRGPPVVAVVPLAGVIAARGLGLGSSGLSIATLAPTLERAFGLRRLAAVALVLNSPGGSAVQSALIATRIRALAAEHKVPVLGFVEDVAASGGYWLACAADEIIADPSSLVGSIGVISAGFGFEDAIGRIGVTRRVHTAGQSKSFLDPFRPEQPEDLARLAAIQEAIHAEFKDWVRSRRGGKLRPPESELFDGRVWTGRAALEGGLVDGLGEVRATLRARFGERVRLVPFGPRRRGLLARLMSQSATSLVAVGLDALEERAARARYGL